MSLQDAQAEQFYFDYLKMKMQTGDCYEDET